MFDFVKNVIDVKINGLTAENLLNLCHINFFDLSQEEISKYRGDFNTPGKLSPYRDRSVEENLELFETKGFE